MAVEANGMLIRIPQGDTGSVKFIAEKSDEIAEDDKAVFTVAYRSGAILLRKLLTPNASDGAFHLPFTYEDTATLNPDTYEWSLRVVRGGTFDGSGKIVSVKGSHTSVLKGRLIVLPVAGGAR